MFKKTLPIFLFVALFVFGAFLAGKKLPKFSFEKVGFSTPKIELAKADSSAPAGTKEKFSFLYQTGNSSCSSSFRESISSMQDSDRLRGSCCSPMSFHRYSEQVEGLKKFKLESTQNIVKIPDDPYNIEAGLAKELLSYYDMELTPEEQKAYDFAMINSNEKGPCCCKCWRWYVYGGLGKYLIRNYGFTGEQITEVWNLSDGCGGDEEHQHG